MVQKKRAGRVKEKTGWAVGPSGVTGERAKVKKRVKEGVGGWAVRRYRR